MTARRRNHAAAEQGLPPSRLIACLTVSMVSNAVEPTTSKFMRAESIPARQEDDKTYYVPTPPPRSTRVEPPQDCGGPLSAAFKAASSAMSSFVIRLRSNKTSTPPKSDQIVVCRR